MGQCTSQDVFLSLSFSSSSLPSSLSLSFSSHSHHFRTQVTLLLYCGNLACSMKGITLSASTNTVIAHTSTKFLTVEWGSYIGEGGK